jgi:hypothetical protein
MAMNPMWIKRLLENAELNQLFYEALRMPLSALWK